MVWLARSWPPRSRTGAPPLPRAAPRTWWSPAVDCLGQSPGSRHLRCHPAEDQRPNVGRHSLWEAGGESLLLGLSVLTPNENCLHRLTAGPLERAQASINASPGHFATSPMDRVASLPGCSLLPPAVIFCSHAAFLAQSAFICSSFPVSFARLSSGGIALGGDIDARRVHSAGRMKHRPCGERWTTIRTLETGVRRLW
jgi:hypothetical protein